MNKLPNADTYGKKICAIIYCDAPQINGKKFLKYSYVDNSPRGLQSFTRFAARFPGAAYINFYCKKDNSFIERHYF